MNKLKKRIIYRIPEIVYALGAVVIAWSAYFILKNIGDVPHSAFWIGALGGAVMLTGTALLEIRNINKKRDKS